MKAILSFVSLLILLFSAAAASASGVEGFWAGTAVRGGEERPITLHVERTPQGLQAHYNIPSLSLEGMPLAGFQWDETDSEITTSRAFQGRLVSGRITGQLFPALLHGPPVEVSLGLAGQPPSLTTSEREVEFQSRGHVLRGWLVSPLRSGRHPALVSLHGSGPSTRWLALARARRFAAAGYAMLIFDKPGSGQSEGDWTMTSLDEMALDAISALEFLRSQPEVDSARTGFWGHSQAGQVIARASTMSGNIAFAIVLAGGGATSREVEDYGYLGRLRRAGASPSATEQAMRWVRDYYDYVRTGQGYDELVARLTAEANSEWVRALGIRTVYPTPAQQPKWQWVATYDPAPDISQMRMPVLLLFAEKDESSPTERSLALWRQGLSAAGNRNVEWKVFADAEHHFLVPAQTDGWPSLAPGYYETQIEWLDRNLGERRENRTSP